MVNFMAVQNPTIKEIFADGGDLSRVLPNYAYRSSQHSAAQMAGHAFRLRKQAVIEAPTGCGKSHAFGIPAALHALESRRPVVISTSNNTLTGQYIDKDLPILAEALASRMKRSHGRTLRYMLAVGRSNLVCKNALRILKNSGRYDQYEALLQSIEDWERVTPTGLMDENPELARNIGLKARLGATRANCVGRKNCLWADSCHFYNLKDSWATADIIVTNHTLLAISLLMPGDILPEFDGFVIDEAHQLDRIVTDQLTIKVNPAQFGLLLETYSEKTQVDTFQVEHDFKDWFREQVRERGRADYPGSILVQLSEMIARIEKEPPLEGLRDSLKENVEAITTFCRPSLAPNRASWVDKNEDTGYLSIKSAPLSSAKFLQERLWKKPGVVTSATLATGSGEGSFDFIKARLGLETKLCLQLPPSFDWAKNCLYVFPQAGALKDSDVTRRNSETQQQWAKRWADKISPTIAAILKKTQGRAFVICTTTAVFQFVYQNLRALGLPFPMKAQGELPKPALTEWFKTTPNPVLVGTSSFREGVDIEDPEQMVCVILDRLEFPNQNRELEAARIKSFGDRAFQDYQLPHCIFVTKQTAGRLMRSTRHRGIFALLDPKVHTKAYVRKSILSVLPGDAVAALDRVGPVDITGFLAGPAAPVAAMERHADITQALDGLLVGQPSWPKAEPDATPFSWGDDLEKAWEAIEGGPREKAIDKFRTMGREQAGRFRERLTAEAIRAALGAA